MAKPAKRKPIAFKLTPKQEQALAATGRVVVLRAKIIRGKLLITHVGRSGGHFIPTNSAFIEGPHGSGGGSND